MAYRIRESVLPSGVSFSVRNLIGRDQNKLRDMIENPASGFNKMLLDAMQSLGSKTKNELIEQDIANMLSNDRIFALLTMRQHTLNYQKTFDFNYDWPVQDDGVRDKDQRKYSVNFTPENFPVKPYYWVREAIARMKKENPEYVVPDGHKVLFPVMYNSYTEMLKDKKIVRGTFPDGQNYQWELLDGNTERQYAVELKGSDNSVNATLDMRKIKILFQADGREVPTMFETDNEDVLNLEHVRGEILEKEGTVDTFLTIQHSPGKAARVNLITLPVFFFPSQAL